MREPTPRVKPAQPGLWSRRITRGLPFAVILAALITIPLVLAEQQGVASLLVHVGDWLAWAVFAVEYAVLLRLATDRRAFVRTNVPRAALILIAFPLLRELIILRELASLDRFFLTARLALATWRLLDALRFAIGGRRVVYIGAVTAVVVLAGGGALAVIEPETVENGFWDGVWWAAVTVTTVGYGDITPKTPGGRLIGVTLMAAGIGLVSTVAASLAAYFIERDVNAARREAARRLERMAGHVVICGLGRKGTLLARSFLERGYEVVAIEMAESTLSIGDLRALGAIVLVGDATDPATLARAKLSTAEGLIAVCGVDDTNADIVIHSNELSHDRVADPLQGLAHIVDPLLCDLFKQMEVGAARAGGFRLQFFNVFDGAARAVLQAHPAFEPGGTEPVRDVLVIGLGILGQRVVFNLARNWRERYRATGERLPITMVDRDAERVLDTLTTRYPQIAAVCALTAQSIEHRSAAFHQGRFLDPAPNGQAAHVPGFGVVYVTLDNDAASLSAGLEVRQKIHDLQTVVVVCMDESTGLVRLLEGVEGHANRIEGLHAFRVLDQTCTPALLLDSTNEILARAHHDDFLRHEVAMGHTAATNPSIVPWDQLLEEMRESSRQAVDHIPVKLHAVGCHIEPMTDWDAELFEFAPAEVEMLAEMEHVRWMAERTRAGYRYGSVRDDVARTHPDLLPWAELTEETKEKDRTFIRGLAAYLASVGFQIIRR